MPCTVFDSFFLKDRFGTSLMRKVWNDRATSQRWLDVEASMAEVEAELGLIPTSAAREIARKAKLENLDLDAMKAEFDGTWNPVVPLVNALRKILSSRAAGYVHWGATSKNIFDIGMILQARDSYRIILSELDSVTDLLAGLAERYRDTVMAGRTHGQHAIPITFGFKAATWLDEVHRQRQRLFGSRKRVLVGEFGGAVGTLAALGPSGLQVQKQLLKRLGLEVPTLPVKTAGDRLAEFVLLLCMLSATLGKIAQNIYNLQQSDIDEVCELSKGKVGSSAMPHKQNPVASGSVVYLGRLLRSNAVPALDYIQAEWEDDHRQGETSWKFLPEVCLLTGAQLSILGGVLEGLIVKPENMLRNLDRGCGLSCSEALMMALAQSIGRDRAHELVSKLADAARSRGVSFSKLVAAHEGVTRHLTPREISHLMDYRNYVGMAPLFVDRALSVHRRARKARGAQK